MAHGARNLFLSGVIDLIKQGEDIYIVAADLGAPCLDEVKEKFPQRLVNVGIAEQNMIAVSCGIALTGKKAVAYTSNPFTIIRAYDQIRNAVANMKIPLVIAGIGTGFSISEYGATHYSVDDYNIMRACPAIQTVTVSDAEMAKQAVQLVSEYKKPYYLRFDKNVEESLYGMDKIAFDEGFRVVKPGEGVMVAASGNDVHQIVDRAQGEPWKIVDLYGYPFDKDSFCRELEGCSKVVTVEENVLPGGLGGAVLEALADVGADIPVVRYGLDFGEGFPEYYGSPAYLRKRCGIDVDEIVERIKEDGKDE